MYLACVSCVDVLKKNNDSLGLITLNSVFGESEKYKFRPVAHGHEIIAKDAKRSSLDGEERMMVELLFAKNEGKLKVLMIHFSISVNEETVS